MTCQSAPDELLPWTDRVVYKMAHSLLPVCDYFNLTPNYVTILSFFCGLLSVYFICRGQVYLGIFVFFFANLFDSLDGCVARKFHMTSKFGDALDHNKDAIIFVLLCVVVVHRYWNVLSTTAWVILIALLIIVYVLSCTYLCCANMYMNKDNSFENYTCLCDPDPRKRAKELVNFAPTNIVLLGLVCIAVLEHVKQSQM